MPAEAAPGAATGPVSIRIATVEDLAFLMAAERTPAYGDLVGKWSEATHRDRLTSPDYRYLIGMRGAAPAGFAILRDPNGNVGLQRIVSARAGAGFGQIFLAGVIDHVFGETTCHRLVLEVFVENARARHVYSKLGFVEEGVARENIARRDGTRGSQVIQSILRPEWKRRAGL